MRDADEQDRAVAGAPSEEATEHEGEEDTNENAATLGRRLRNLSKQVDQFVHGSNHVIVNKQRFDQCLKT